jgi:hypothetical protein
MQTLFKSASEFTTKVEVTRTRQRKFKLATPGEPAHQMPKGKALALAVQTAVALNFHPEATTEDVAAAERMTTKLGPGVPSDPAVIRSGVSLAGKRVTLTYYGFGRYVLRVDFTPTPIRKRDPALKAYAKALKSKV